MTGPYEVIAVARGWEGFLALLGDRSGETLCFLHGATEAVAREAAERICAALNRDHARQAAEVLGEQAIGGLRITEARHA